MRNLRRNPVLGLGDILTSDMEEWQPAGVILYTDVDHIPRLKIIANGHTYEMQACKFDPIMQIFSILVDGEFKPSKYDSLDRLLKLDEASKSGHCSEREQLLMNQIEALKQQIECIMKEKEQVEHEHKDLQVVIFDSV